MKLGFAIALSLTFGAALTPAQAPQADSISTPHKVVVTNNLPAPTRIVQPTPRPQVFAEPQAVPSAAPSVRPRVVTDDTGTITDASFQPAPAIDVNNLPRVSLSFGEIKGKIAEA